MSTSNSAKITYGERFVMRFVTFSGHSNSMTDIRFKTVELLDHQQIKHTSVDLVRFRWEE